MDFSQLRAIIKKKRCQIAVFYNLGESQDKTLYYLSRYKGVGCLVVPLRGKPFIIAPQMEYEMAQKTSGLKVYKWEKGTRLFETLATILKKKKIPVKQAALVYESFSVNAYRSLQKYLKVKAQDISLECLILRRVKTEEELELLKKSAQITDTIIKKCIDVFDTFKTEKDVETFLHLETVKHGCELAFPPVVASGKGGSMAHYEPRDVKLRNGFCVIDFGVKYKGYHSDITRTIYLGIPSTEEKEFYELLIRTQKSAICNVKKGKKCKELYDEVVLALGKYADKFTHSLGHGLGLQIHELPNLSPKSEETFENNMVFTIEPGIYFAGRFGIRIEDDILLKNNKVIVLTKTPKKLIIKKAR